MQKLSFVQWLFSKRFCLLCFLGRPLGTKYWVALFICLTQTHMWEMPSSSMYALCSNRMPTQHVMRRCWRNWYNISLYWRFVLHLYLVHTICFNISHISYYHTIGGLLCWLIDSKVWIVNSHYKSVVELLFWSDFLQSKYMIYIQQLY